MGKIELIIGPMFSGKSTEVNRRISRYKLVKKTVILKWDGDFRKDETKDEFITHSNIKVKCVRVKVNLMLFLDKVQKYDVIAIDEGHFFQNLFEFVKIICNRYGKIVIISALDSDSKQVPFLEVCKLVSIADEILKLKSLCGKCFEENAIFNYKINSTNETKRIDVGGREKYIPLCRECMIQHTSPILFKIAVLGNIGSGKSTLCKNLEVHFNTTTTIFSEKLKNFYGKTKVFFETPNQTHLAEFYEDKKKNWYWFQNEMVQKRLLTINELNDFKEGLVILDRWVEEDCLFPANLYKNKIADKKRYDIYKSLFDILIKTAPKVYFFIYLKNSPETCFANLQKRNNQSESKVPLDYITSLGKLYDEFENFMKSKYKSKFIVVKNDPFIVIDEVLKLIVNFINSPNF